LVPKGVRLSKFIQKGAAGSLAGHRQELRFGFNVDRIVLPARRWNERLGRTVDNELSALAGNRVRAVNSTARAKAGISRDRLFGKKATAEKDNKRVTHEANAGAKSDVWRDGPHLSANIAGPHGAGPQVCYGTIYLIS